jgi:hypothetical protein
MVEGQSQTDVSGVVRTTQIIVVALCLGIASFGLYVIVAGEDGKEAKAEMLTYMSLGMAVVCAGMSLVVPRTIVAANRRQIADGTWHPQNSQTRIPDSDAGKLAAVYQMKTIVGGAILEGAAFFALVAYMIEGHIMSLAVAGVLLLGVLSFFPTTGRVADWVQEQQRLVEEHRQLSG